MSLKSVLLCFGERKTVLSVNWITFNASKALEEAAKSYPSLADDYGKVVFQKYNREWGEWIDLNDGDGITDKDKISVLVIAPLTDLCATIDVSV